MSSGNRNQTEDRPGAGRKPGFQTELLHGRSSRRGGNGATLPEISQCTAYAYDTAEELERVFAGRAPGFVYTRIGNPTVSAFEQRVNELEGGAGAAACASGMAAIAATLLNILSAGDEVIAPGALFGGTLDLFRDLEKFGITVRYVPELTPENVENAVNGRTRAVFGEVISNPALQVADVKALAESVHGLGLPLILDSTTATPFLVRPIELGADLVIHSASKYMNGCGSAVGGVIVDSGRFAWDPERYPALKDYRKFGKLAFLARLRNDTGRNFGACLAPANAYLNVLGLETLGLRMDRICRNAYELAAALSGMDGIEVRYPLLPDSPYRELCRTQLGGRGGGILTFRAGSRERASRIINSLALAETATNIGDVRTLVIPPASTIFLHSTEEERAAAGVYEDTVRVSVGIEDPEDLIADFTQAVEKL